jgi:hypothetical protein
MGEKAMLRRRLLSALPLVGLLTGCATISGGVAPSTTPLTPGSYQEMGSVRGTDCVYYLLGFIPLTTGNETRDAVANAMAQVPGATALTNVSVDTYSQYFILFSRVCTQVYGVAVAPK